MTTDIILYIITCVSFFLLAFISFLNPLKINIVANKWFGLFLFSVGCMLLNFIIYSVKAEAAYTRLIAFGELSRFAMAPALYLSVLHYVSPDKEFKSKSYLHFIPFMVFFIYLVPNVIAPQFRFGELTILPAVVGRFIPVLLSSSIKIQLFVYWVLAYRKLDQHQKNIQLIASSTGPINLQWLRLLLLGIAFMIFLWFNTLFFKIQLIESFSTPGYFAGVLFICYFLLAQKEIYPYNTGELNEIELVIKEVRTTKPRFSEDSLLQLKEKLAKLMDAEKLYLDNELGLPQLAAEMNISSHDLSYLLNEGFGKNFFQFINSYRVEEAKQLMLSEKHKHLNILGIAYSAGFNSKTTFNTSFKKETGLSPSQFVQQFKESFSAAALNS
ncbi:MAG: AraC family transcriptional regulator [Ferruginibacter sp.]